MHLLKSCATGNVKWEKYLWRASRSRMFVWAEWWGQRWSSTPHSEFKYNFLELDRNDLSILRNSFRDSIYQMNDEAQDEWTDLKHDSAYHDLFETFAITVAANLPIWVKRLEPRLSDFGKAQHFKSNDNFLHFWKHYIWSFVLLQRTFFYYATDKRFL